MENKNKEKLLSFIDYCLEHPEYRFWQALRNWSQYHFIFGYRTKNPLSIDPDTGQHTMDELEELLKMRLEDTFYWK